MSATSNRSTHVYVMATDLDGVLSSPVKIGMTKDPRKRLETIQTACPFKIVLYGAWELSFEDEMPSFVERAVHGSLKKYRLHGEWFSVEPLYAAHSIELAIAMIAVGCGLDPIEASDFAYRLRSHPIAEASS